MRRLLTWLLVLAALLVGADRGGAYLAGRLVASRVQTAGHLASPPTVTFEGIPFLTQVARGDFTQVDVTAHGVVAGPVVFDTVTARLYGVKASISRAVHGNLRQVVISRGEGTALVSYAELDAVSSYRHLGVQVAPAGSDVQVTGTLHLFGTLVRVVADAAVSVSNGTLVVRPLPQAMHAVTGALSGAFAAAAVGLLTLRVHPSALPFGVSLTSVAVTPAGLLFGASATGFVVPTG